jgi:hypothetical protein
MGLCFASPESIGSWRTSCDALAATDWRRSASLRAYSETEALAMIAKEYPDALFVYPDVVLSSYPRPQQLADFALKAHLPTMHAFCFFVDAGGLMSYGATQSEIYTSAAEQVAKIPDGARPSELPLRRQRGSSWSSTTGLRRHSNSQSHRRCLPLPTR